jgi:hypothetical protein
MAVKRTQRRVTVQPIGVNRFGATGENIAQQVVGLADDLYQRGFERAREGAIKRGEETAAEASLASITTLNQSTQEPEAMQLAASMGRYSAEAFERVIIRRFENSTADAIQAKKAELMARIGDSPNAPKLFEQAFSQYLDGLGSNASGYYRQVIVDNGANALKDGRTRLHVAQIERMRAAAKQAEAERKDRLVAQARDNAANEDTGANETSLSSTISTAKKVAVEEQDNISAGVSEYDDLPKFQKRIFNAELEGFTERRLKNPIVSKNAGLIFTYLEQGGNPELLKMMPPEAQDFVKDLEARGQLYGSSAYGRATTLLRDEFAAASSAGAAFAAEEERQIKLNEAEQQAVIDAKKQNAALLEEQVKTQNTDGFGKMLGQFGSMAEVRQRLADLNQVDYNPNEVGRDLNSSINSNISRQKADIAEGLLIRSLDRLNAEQQSLLANAVRGGDLATIADYMPGVWFSIFAREYSSNQESMAATVSAWASGSKQRFDEAQAREVIAHSEAVRITSGILQNNALSRDEKLSAYNTYVETWGSSKFVEKEFISSRKDLDSYLRTDQEERDKQTFNSYSESIVRTDLAPEKLQTALAGLETMAKTTNAAPEDVIKTGQAIVNKSAIQSATQNIQVFGESPEAALQLREMSRYAETGNITPALTREAKQVVDIAMSLKGSVAGTELSVNKKSLSDFFIQQSNTMDASIKAVREAENNERFAQNYTTGKPILNPDNEATQNKVSNLLAVEAGVSQVPSDIFERQPSTFNEQEARIVTLAKNNKSVVPIEYVNSARRALAGNLGPDAMNAFITNTREMMFTMDSSGSLRMNNGVYAALGRDTASKIETMALSYQFAPIGSEGAYMVGVAEQLNQPMTKDMFYERNGKKYKSPEEMVLDAGVPSSIAGEVVPLARHLVNLHGENAFDMLESAVEYRFSNNPNGYSATTGGSFVELDPSTFTDDVDAFEDGVSKIVERINRRDGTQYYFNKGAKTSIEDVREDSLNIAEAMFTSMGREAEQLMLADRVLYGPALNSTREMPVFQLYAMNEFGAVDPIADSMFTMNSLEIATSMFGILPPARPQPAPTALEIQGAVEEPAVPPAPKSPAKPKKTEYGVDITPRYTSAPSPQIIEPDDKLVKDISRVIGKGSVASKLISEYSGYSMAQKQTNITRIIKSVEDMPSGGTRDKILERLYEIRNSLRGR